MGYLVKERTMSFLTDRYVQMYRQTDSRHRPQIREQGQIRMTAFRQVQIQTQKTAVEAGRHLSCTEENLNIDSLIVK